MKRLRWLIAAGVLAVAVPAVALAGALTLHPSGFGPKTYASWKANEGQPDSQGAASEALYFQKGVPTSTFAAALAFVRGLEGEPVTSLTGSSLMTGLSWEHRNDGHCGAGAPRWSFGITGASGQRHTIFLGCAAALHTPSLTPGWTRDSYPGPAIEAQVLAQGGADALAWTIRGLAIVFDEGTDTPGRGLITTPGRVFLDNITVNTEVWTSAADNGSG